jgi:hypothetical protein
MTEEKRIARWAMTASGLIMKPLVPGPRLARRFVITKLSKTTPGDTNER